MAMTSGQPWLTPVATSNPTTPTDALTRPRTSVRDTSLVAAPSRIRRPRTYTATSASSVLVIGADSAPTNTANQSGLPPPTAPATTVNTEYATAISKISAPVL